jgi:hypothetical protein
MTGEKARWDGGEETISVGRMTEDNGRQPQENPSNADEASCRPHHRKQSALLKWPIIILWKYPRIIAVFFTIILFTAPTVLADSC